MRPVALVFVSIVGVVACSRPPPPPADPPPPVAKQETAKLVLAAAVEETDAGATPPPPAPPSLSGKKILHAGDSMVGGEWGLTRALEKKFTAEGATFVRHYKVSEAILNFEKTHVIADLIAKHSPDIVILTLGTNDTLSPFPQSLATHVANIAKQMGGRECYWMTPPITKKETGITQVIRDNAAPCTVFDSSKLKLEIGKDGIHPTERGAQEWAARFWTFFRAPKQP
jgi:lysophospholipase L1-like esterase